MHSFKLHISLLACGLLLNIPFSFSQTTQFPKVSRQIALSARIEKVEVSKDATIIYLIYKCEFKDGCYANIKSTTYIREKGSMEKKMMTRQKGLPYAPAEMLMNKGENVRWIMHFPALNPGITSIDLIEIADNTEGAFNFYGVQVKNDLKADKPSTIEKPPVKDSTITFSGKALKTNDSLTLNILFDYATDVITPESETELKKLEDFLKRYPSVTIELSGHTEADEKNYTPEQRNVNLQLSRKRINKIVEYLKTHNIDSTRIKTKAYGGTRPISTDPAKNRRVVMRILSK